TGAESRWDVLDGSNQPLTLSCERSVVDFFFSSRRRHTRFSRDWSSDVALPILQLPGAGGSQWCVTADGKVLLGNSHHGLGFNVRSEERRVGKESRKRWVADRRSEKQLSVQARVTETIAHREEAARVAATASILV